MITPRTGSISSNLSTKHLWVEGIYFCSNEGQHLPRVDNYELTNINSRNLKIFPGGAWPISTKLQAQIIIGWRGNQVCSNEGPFPFPLGDNYEIEKNTFKNLKIFFFPKALVWPISIKLGTKHPWVKKVQVCSNKGSRFFPKGDYYEITKIHWRNLKIFLSRRANINQTWHKASTFLGEGDSSLFKWRATPFSKGI